MADWIVLNIDELKLDYNNGKSLRELARKYKTSKQTIKKKLNAAGIATKTSLEQVTEMSIGKRLTPAQKLPDANVVIKHYLEENLDASDIGKLYHCTETRVLSILKNAGIQLRKPNLAIKEKIIAIVGEQRAWWDNSNILYDMYVKKLMSISKIASTFTVDAETIRCKLKKYNIERRDLSTAGKLSASKQESKENRSKISKALHADPNYRSKLSAALKLKWTDQEYRKKILGNLHNITISKQQYTLYDMLDTLKIKHDIEHIIGPWTFDCLLLDYNILIECQGDYWHSLPDRIRLDDKKAKYINDFHPHLRLVYFWEHEFKEPNKILQELGILTGIKIDTLEFKFSDIIIKEIDRNTAKQFLEKYHYSGTIGNNNYHIGAFLGDTLIATCGFGQITRLESVSKLQLHRGEYTELTRFCIKPGYNINNMASWFLSKSIKMLAKHNKNIKSIITFADNTYGHTGTIYKACNFKEIGKTAPSYWYVDVGGWGIHKKTVWDKAKLRGISEEEYAAECGYRKVNGSYKTKYIYSI